MSYQECLLEYRDWRKKHKQSDCDLVIRTENRRRVNPDRGEKKHFTWAQISRAYKRQRGICPVCTHEMALDRNKLHGDHWDCNLTVEEGLNSENNCVATHKNCNLKKGTKHPAELSKLRQLNPVMGNDESSIIREPIEDET